MSFGFLLIILLVKVFVFVILFQNTSHYIYPVIYILLNIGSLVAAVILSQKVDSRWVMTPSLGIFRSLMIMFIVVDLFLAVFFLLDQIVLLFAKITSSFEWSKGSYSDGRRTFLRQIGVFIAAFPFFSFIYGIFFGKYAYKLRRVVLEFDNLPNAFDGFKLVQFSDFHAGSFDDPIRAQKGLNKINELDPDLIVFTGDMVNLYSDEIKPYKKALTKLKAKHGKIAILGNHDYYGEKYEGARGDVQKLVNHEREAGFNVLLNENVSVNKDGDSIVIVGLENWGNGPFPKYGDMKRALKGTSEDDFRIVLTHDPSHWEEEIKHREEFIPLTLCGHTHGMQFGIELPFFRWSPIQYAYKKWAGLYREGNRMLYINRGYGYLWFSGRVGIWPEITEIILKKSSVN